ncbi:LytR/AlgR family response regulator transcription factor [Jejuia pallidilutea]|uniref:Response regulator receiver n=1 Tax=Jejuia pallidilutea TaxID=504487 RepID=A0A090VUD3_9FLAO|nr:response regulator transcription factor [Jejuia pallidilutea]GAL66879.1 response regulator receiver [Jejuia pallidilutea]GAL70334.1 response regulator receiver [Jejuia pallidilutea]GAL90418.1 response regulator receiver [Jejuia pallidilutea]
MDKVNVLIIEDTPSESKVLIKTLEANNYDVVGVATTFKEAIQLFHNNAIDIAVVDIFLNGNPDGIAFAETINLTPKATRPFVFLTSSTDRAIFERAKLTQPFSYLLKPFNELEILYALEMAVEKFYEQPDVFLGETEDTIISNDYLFIKKGKSLKKVYTKDIIYIEVEEKYCNVITETEKFVILISLTKILKLLDSAMFCRTHRNFIVNTEKIEEIIPADNLIILSGNHKATLSETYKDILKRVKTLR